MPTPASPAFSKAYLGHDVHQDTAPGPHTERKTSVPMNRYSNHGSRQSSRQNSVYNDWNNLQEAQQRAMEGEELQLPSTAIARLTLRTSNNLRMWYLRRNNARASKRRTEQETMREIERSQLLFSQAFTISPLVLITSSGLRPEEAGERKVPALLQQLSIRVSEEHAKHYANLVRIQLEYGSGLGLIKWEVLRGYRDLLFLRSKLRSHNKLRNRGPKLPKLPTPKAFGLLDLKKNALFKRGYKEKNDNDFLAVMGEFEDSEEDFDYDDENDGMEEEDEEEEEDDEEEDEEEEPLPNPNGHQESYDERVSTFAPNDHQSNRTQQFETRSMTSFQRAAYERRSRYAKAVEVWLNKVKEIYMLRSDSNELMQFLEMSHLSLKLAPEYTFHGKEGTMFIRSRASDMGWRVNHFYLHDLREMVERHTKKWVLIRDSYIVIVDNIYSTFVREVFLVDSHFEVKHITAGYIDSTITSSRSKEKDEIRALPDIPHAHKSRGAKSVFLHLVNNERELKLTTRTDRDLRRWQASIMQMKAFTPWSKKNRFDSFAPVRKNVFGKWFVDARDYMWVLSDALENARDTIYILDWWLSPELYLRRPPEGNQKWRLDRVLKRKAEQGVKIFVVVYRNVNAAIPIDSLWTKHSLLGLHDNIHVMRSPNQLKNQASLFWAHHEKLCIIDSTIAFNGGIDLCFGRWDTWEHTLVDDASAPFLPAEPSEEQWKHQKTQLFPGKEYNNARVKDFYDLNRPWEETHDRNYVPRMPWHDIHQMVLGQPARDFCRHFVQRWNYIIRQKIPSRPTPFLLPPPDFSQEDLERLQLTGTCEYQVLRSSGEWSLGLKQHEQSIQNAYLQLIEESEHLVYIENQFFVTSTKVDGVLIENQIGNALVQRIVRAHQNGEQWKAFILIPLMPGFEAEVDSEKASSVRIICQCQFNSISRGPNSIFYRLEQMGIRPDQYINFFSLRKWGKFSDTEDSPNGGRLATELLYIHAKCLIVDDRVAIIGSANINERSMRGVRDSEVAVCVRDTKVVETKMAGKPYRAGKFAHTLRMRLMREHLGVDVDKLEIVERFMAALDTTAKRVKEHRHNRAAHSHKLHQQVPTIPPIIQDTTGYSTKIDDSKFNNPEMNSDEFPDWLYPELHSFNWYAGTNVNKGIRAGKKLSRDSRIHHNEEHNADVNGDGIDHWKIRLTQETQAKRRQIQAAEPDIEMEKEAREIMEELLKDRSITSRDQFKRIFYSRFSKKDIMRPLKRAAELPMPHVDEEGMRAVNCENIPVDPWAFSDPVDERFVRDMLIAAAERNTLIFRLVFRCQPDDEVETWKDYKTYAAHLERFYEKQREDGGPNALRKSGVHKPERVNKLVLSGDIKQTDPEVIKQQILNATKPGHDHAHHHRQMSQEEKTEHEMRSQGLNCGTEFQPRTGGTQNAVYKADNEEFYEVREDLPESTPDGVGNATNNSRKSIGPTTRTTAGHSAGNLNVNGHANSHATSHNKDHFSNHSIGDATDKPNGSIANRTSEKAPAESTDAHNISQGTADVSFQPARKWGHFDHVLDAQVAEDILQGITGHLVVFPTEWLNRELDSGNWNFQLDRMAPLEIYD